MPAGRPSHMRLHRSQAEQGATAAQEAAARSQQERERLLEQIEELSGQLQKARCATSIPAS